MNPPSETNSPPAGDPLRVAVVGVGAVGGVFAAHLSAVHDVVACVRRPFDQYRIDSSELPFVGPATSVTDPGQLPWDQPADAVLVGFKAQHTDAAAHWFEPLCGPETLVAIMQNGIEGRERLQPLVNGAELAPAVVYCGAELLEPGHVRHDNQARLIVAESPAGERLSALCQDTPLRIDQTAEFDRSAWVKLGINSVVNGLTGLTGKPSGVLSEPGIGDIAATLLRECWTTGRAAGVDLELDGIGELVARIGANAEGRTSMQHDREAGRATEHDAIHGAVLRKADQFGTDVPMTRIIHDLLAAASPD